MPFSIHRPHFAKILPYSFPAFIFERRLFGPAHKILAGVIETGCVISQFVDQLDVEVKISMVRRQNRRNLCDCGNDLDMICEVKQALPNFSSDHVNHMGSF